MASRSPGDNRPQWAVPRVLARHGVWVPLISNDLTTSQRSTSTHPPPPPKKEEAREVHGGSDKAVQGILRRLSIKGEIATPLRDFHLVIPPEHRRLGCLPPLWFIDDLAAHLSLRYYVALLSAAELHGAAHQRPQTFQVMLPSPLRPIICGGVRVDFAMRSNLDEAPVVVRNTLVTSS